MFRLAQATPVAVVSRWSVPGKPLQMRLCIDKHTSDSLLPVVMKPAPKVKGVPSLMPIKDRAYFLQNNKVEEGHEL